MTFLLLSLLALDVPADQAAESSNEVAAPDPGVSAYATCGGCHGAQGQGNPALNAPALAGQDADYTARQLRNYKAGIRGADPEDPEYKFWSYRPLHDLCSAGKIEPELAALLGHDKNPYLSARAAHS